MTLVEFRNVSFAYPASEERGRRPFALADLSFEILPGEIIGVIGPNSSGKTTLIRLLTRVLEPAGGEVRLEDVPVRRLSRTDLARRVAVVPQGMLPQFPFTVGELVLMGRYPHDPGRYFESPRDRAVARQAMAAMGVLEIADMPLEHLSGGERQRAVIARALAQEPRLLVLDEPTAHLDLRYQVEAAALLRRLNRERGMTILLVSHDLNLAAEVCDRLLLLHGGRAAAIGSPEAVLDEALLASVFGCGVVVDKSETTRRPIVRLTWRTDPPIAGGAPARDVRAAGRRGAGAPPAEAREQEGGGQTT
jgi:ABC-type cobalamin/Fe3+-siderophores transport system ATPase subunit